MLKLRRFTRTMLAVLTVYFLVLLAALYLVSGALVRGTTRRLAEKAVSRGVEDGLRLLEKGGDRQALCAAVNPEVNPAGVFLILLDPAQALLAQTDGAALPRETDFSLLSTEKKTTLIASDEMMLMGQKSEYGAALAGISLADSNRAAFSFRALMRQYGAIAVVLTLVMLFLLAWRIMQPVDTLVSAAQRISEGEAAEVPERLPVELRPLGRAFNHMSSRLRDTMGEMAQERDTLSQVLEGLDEGVLAMDQQGDLLRENQAALRLLGGQGTPAATRVLAALRRAVDAPQEDMRLQVGERTLLVMLRPLTARPGALAVLRDVTEAERLERTRHEYVANISHELRTPLASMRGITEGLCDGLVTEEGERRRYYSLLLGEVSRLSRLVNDLLELGKLQSSPAAFAVSPVDALEALYELHDRTQALAREKGIALRLDVPDRLPPVFTNEDRLQQVLTILLDNAIKFTPAGGEVALCAQQEARYVRFSVRDNGIGMDEHTLRHAFDRFHQADTSHGAKGSGLGLAIAREIMQRLDSRIVARSAPGKGSEFSFLIRVQG